MRFRLCAVCLGPFVLAALVFAVARNNARTEGSRAEMRERLNRSYLDATDWLIVRQPTPDGGLIYMLRDCAEVSGDKRLMEYARRMEASGARSGKENPEVLALNTNRSEDATHQLFALQQVRKVNGRTPASDALIRRVAERIAREATFDFRVTGLYLQRVAVLVGAGQTDLVKSRWVERALARQRPSGGWFSGWYLWSSSLYRLDLDEKESSQTTTEGLWMACMLRYRYPEWVSEHYR